MILNNLSNIKSSSGTLNSLISFLLALMFPAMAFAGHYPTMSSSYLDSVDFYLQRAESFTDKALESIRARKQELHKYPVKEQLRLMADIGKQLEQIDIGAAMDVYTEAASLAKANNDERFIKKFRYRQGSVMPMMGLVHEGIDVYESITPDMVDSLDKYDYFTTGHHIFDAAVDYYRVDSLKQKYNRLSVIYADSALVYVTPGSIEESYYKAIPKLSGGDLKNGINELINVLQNVEIENPLFAKAAAEIASAYATNNQWDEARYYLALSAIGDLRAGTRETTSLHRLGKILSNQDDFVRAYDYLVYALESADASDSRLRTLEIGEIMPVVVKAGRQLERQNTRTLIIVVISLSVAIIIFAFILFYTFRTRDRLNSMKEQLVEMNDSKDTYIRKLLSLCGAYLEALDNFNKLAGRKIKVGQINDLLAMIESGKVIREQLQNFYEVFDDAFLAVYPDFVDRVNELLLPDKQLSLTEDDRLGTELRIVAFMRLGLDDSAQIAKFLGLSLNTIYTYRNKVKTRAKDRLNFENDIRKIGQQPLEN